MKVKMVVLLLTIILSGCAPATTPAPAAVLPTLAPDPTITAAFVIPTPSLIPTQPPVSVLTPDAIQVQRWREYQTELANVVLSSDPELGYDPTIYQDALCEWDILGQAKYEVYVYVVCVIANSNRGARKPAIIYLESDGSIQKVKLTAPKPNSDMFDYDPFPKYVQEKFCYYFDPFPSDLPPCPYPPTDPRPRLNVLYMHIEYRKTHPEVPPLVVLSATQTMTPSP